VLSLSVRCPRNSFVPTCPLVVRQKPQKSAPLSWLAAATCPILSRLCLAISYSPDKVVLSRKAILPERTSMCVWISLS